MCMSPRSASPRTRPLLTTPDLLLSNASGEIRPPRAPGIRIAAALSAQTEPPLRIGTITIHPLDVYSSDEARHGALYKLADRLHIETRKSVIEKFLLFREGDVVQSRAAGRDRAQSARAAASSNRPPSLPPSRTTASSTSPSPRRTRGRSRPRRRPAAKAARAPSARRSSETNLLGLGKDLELGWQNGVDRSRIGVVYSDPAFFAPYWKANFGYA